MMVPAMQGEHSTGRGKQSCSWTPESINSSGGDETDMAAGAGPCLGVGKWWDMRDHSAHSTYLYPCRDTDIYDDVEIYGRCTELLPYSFTGHSDHYTSTRCC